jgi:GPH family glycoside/pentoside/hexuronide:cation symporter
MNLSRSKEFTWVEGLGFLAGAIANQISSEMIAQWLQYFYSPTTGGVRTIFVSLSLVGYAVVLGRVFDGIIDPIIGVCSDVTKSNPGRWRFPRISGRRRPFMFWGSIFVTITGILIWFPPVNGQSVTNFYFLAVVVCLHWLFFTIACIPLMALGPEVARSQEARLKLGVWWAAGMVIGIALAYIVVPQLISSLKPPVSEAMTAGNSNTIGYQRSGIVLSLFALLLFQLPVWLIRERRIEESESTELAGGFASKMFDAWRAMGAVLTNWPFVVFLAAQFMFNVGLLAMQRVMPNYAEVVLHGDEGLVGTLYGPYILTSLVTALAFYPFLRPISERIPLKWLLVAVFVLQGSVMPAIYVLSQLPLDDAQRVSWGMVVFGISGVGQGINYVTLTALLGEIIDYDDSKFNQRREAVFNGVYLVATKFAQAVALYVSTVVMTTLGSSMENPTGIIMMGPIGGVFALVALGILWFYPVLKVTKRTEE